MTDSMNGREAHLWQSTREILAALPSSVSLAVYRSAILHWFNLEILLRLRRGQLPHELPGESSAGDRPATDEFFATLIKLPFVEAYGTRFSAEPDESRSFAIHELTRKIILQHLWKFEEDFVRSFSREAAELYHVLENSDETKASIYVLERLYHLLLVDEEAALSELRDRMAKAGRKGEFGQLQALARVPAEHVSSGRLSTPAAQWANVLFGYSLAVAGALDKAQDILEEVRDRGAGRLGLLGSARVEATLILATLCEDTGQYAKARDLYDDATHDLDEEGTGGKTEDTLEAMIGALAGAARMCMAQDLLDEAVDLYGKCLKLYTPISSGQRLLFRKGSSAGKVRKIGRITGRSADYLKVADVQEPDHWHLEHGLLWVQVNPESGRVYREIRPSALFVDLWTQVGELYGGMGSQGKAKRAAWLARAASEALDDPWVKAEVGILLVQLGSATGEVDLRKDGVKFLLSVVEAARSDEDIPLELAAELSIGDARLASGENDSATKSFGKALELARSLGSRRDESSALVGLGRVASRASRDEEARLLFGNAIEHLQTLKHHKAVADVQLRLARLEIGAERWKAAEESVGQALAEYRFEKRRSGQAEALTLMGEVAKGRGNALEAEGYLREAIALSAEVSIPSIQIASQTGLARIHRILQHPGRARALYAEAFTLAVQADLKVRQAEVLMGEGWVEYETENFERAKEKFSQAFQIYSGTQDLVGQAEARVAEASAERVLGNLDRAVDLSSEAVDLAERSGKKSLCMDAERAYAVTLGEAGRAEEALWMFQNRPLRESAEDANILGGLGWSLYVLGRYEESIKASSAGYLRDPSQIWILRNLGLAYLANGDPEKAKRSYHEALLKTRFGNAVSDATRDVERLLERRPDTRGGQDVLVMLQQWTPTDEDPVLA